MVGASSSRCHYLSSQAMCSTYTIMHYSRERDKQAAEVEEDEDEALTVEKGMEKWIGLWGGGGGVNRSLIQHIPSLDSCAPLNKAFDTGCYWS